MPQNVIVGVNILETLTTGMYRDPLTIYREYIQNSCDAIDAAVEGEIMAQTDGEIAIVLNDADASVSITDNGVGIPSAIFRETLYSIGESQKMLGKQRGFRGIGHWCGLAHFDNIKFIAKARGEDVESFMSCDAKNIRAMMSAHRTRQKLFSLDDVLSSCTSFGSNRVEDANAHYFIVIMSGIDTRKKDICNIQKITDYLSFTAPVGYNTAFRFRDKIHDYAKEHGHTIREYNIRVNQNPVLKNYHPTFSTFGKGEDTIKDVMFKEFTWQDGEPIAWMWIGISNFMAKMTDKMHGIRLRSHNIQIGSANALQRLFKEDRGTYYFIGELMAESENLLPDSQRDYFEPGEARDKFETILSEYCNNDLKNMYNLGSNVNAAYDKLERQKNLMLSLKDSTHLTKKQQNEINNVAAKAEKAKKELKKIKDKLLTASADTGDNALASAIESVIKYRDEHLNSLEPQKRGSSDESFDHQNKVKPSAPQSRKDTSNDNKFVRLKDVLAIISSYLETDLAEDLTRRIKQELG